jgi:hypothetical protein
VDQSRRSSSRRERVTCGLIGINVISARGVMSAASVPPNTSTPRTRGNRHGASDRVGATMTKSKVAVWSVIALGLACSGASAIMLAVAYLIWIAPRKKLDELDIDRDDAAMVLIYRSFPFLVLSVLIFAATSIVLASKKA